MMKIQWQKIMASGVVAAGLAGSGAALAVPPGKTLAEKQDNCSLRLSGLYMIEQRIAAASDPGLFEVSTRFDEARAYFNRLATAREKPEALVIKIESYVDDLRHKYVGQVDGLDATHREATAYANECYIYYDETVVMPRLRLGPR